MKKTKAQQEETRRRILEAVAGLFVHKGYEATTMKDVARASGIGDATIYKYFASKERLVLGYFDQAVADALQAFNATPGLAGYALQESLQRLTDAILERLARDRELVMIGRDLLRRAPLLILGEQLALKQNLRLTVMRLLEHAEATWEIEPCDCKSLLSGLYVDYLLGVLAYWLNDDSEDFAQTTELVDLSLGLGVLILRSGVINKGLSLGGFMLRSQLARGFASGTGLIDLLKTARNGDESNPSPESASATSRKAKPKTKPEAKPATKPATKRRSRT